MGMLDVYVKHSNPGDILFGGDGGINLKEGIKAIKKSRRVKNAKVTNDPKISPGYSPQS